MEGIFKTEHNQRFKNTELAQANAVLAKAGFPKVINNIKINNCDDN